MLQPGTAVRNCMNVARRARVAGPNPPRHMGPTHPPANRPLQKTTCTQDCVGVNACIHLKMDMDIILSCASHACNMEVRPRTGSGTDTGTQAHGEEHRSTFFFAQPPNAVTRAHVIRSGLGTQRRGRGIAARFLAKWRPYSVAADCARDTSLSD